MAIFVRDPNEILSEARSRLIGNTPVTNMSPGGTARAILEVVASRQAEQYIDLSFNINQTFVSKAIGENLDLVGVLLNVLRGESKRAIDITYKTFRFFIDGATGFTGSDLADIMNTWLAQQDRTSSYVGADNFTIPAGTTINNAAGSPYTTMEDALFTASDTEIFVPVISSVIGSLGNTGVGALNTHVLARDLQEFGPVANLILCDNLLPITNGRDVEGDDSYRFRITNEALASRNANITSIRMAALSVPGVSDIIVRNFSHGVGTFSVFVLSTDPIVATGLLNAVQSVIEDKAAAGIRAVVQAPIYRGLEMTATLEFFSDVGQAERDELKNQTRRFLVNHTNNIPMGQGFVVNKAIQGILDVSDRIKDAHIANMTIGEYDTDNAINARRFPVFVINQNLFWDEKFYTNSGLITMC